MTPADSLRLISLAAIWGSGFLFMKIGAPVLGPVILIESRVGFGALFLAVVALFIKTSLNVRENLKHYFILGFFNCAFPFLLFAYAAQSLTASMSSILNATSPIWAAVISAVLARQMMTKKSIIGLALGILGVGIIVVYDEVSLQPGAILAILAMLGGALSVGIATNYTKSAKPVSSFANAQGSLWAATLLILPAVPFFPAFSTPSIGVMSGVVTLGILCSGIAYLLFFRLIQDLGPTSALSVTFLIPFFGVLWGHIFLNEEVGWHTVIGIVIVLAGTILVTGFNLSAFNPYGAKKAI